MTIFKRWGCLIKIIMSNQSCEYRVKLIKKDNLAQIVRLREFLWIEE
jgi:hypothetical protein